MIRIKRIKSWSRNTGFVNSEFIRRLSVASGEPVAGSPEVGFVPFLPFLRPALEFAN